MKDSAKKIVIIGLGLMGGSLAAALRQKLPHCRIAAVTRNKKALSYALRKGWIHEGCSDLETALVGADLAVLCTPVDTEIEFLKAIDRAAHKPLCVTDVGSVKGELLSQTNKAKFRRISFVPAHPMVGSHEQGIQAASAHLYNNGLVFLIRTSGQSKKAFLKVQSFWKVLTPRIVTVKAEQHDAIVGDISHLPHAAAFCLMAAADPRHFAYAASGFKDTTRVAAAPPTIWEPIFLANSKVLDRLLGRYEKEIRAFRKMVRSKNSKALRRKLLLSSRRRQEI